MTPEDKIHAGVLVATLLAAATWLPATADRGHSQPPTLAPGQPKIYAKPLNMMDLQKAITRLDATIEAQHRRGGPKDSALLELQALGYPRISRGPQHSRMTVLLPATDSSNSGPSITDRATTLSVLLELGWQLSRPIPFAGDKLPLGKKVEATLAEYRLNSSTHRVDAVELNLRALFEMSGGPGNRQYFGDLTRAALVELTKQYRNLNALRGQGSVDPLGRHALLELKNSHPDRTDSSVALSSAALRAAAILREPELLTLALRHGNSLAFRARHEIEFFQNALASTRSAERRHSIRLNALESLGRLGQALHAASLVAQRQTKSPPSAVLAAPMLGVAAELVRHLRSDDLKSLGNMGSNLPPRSLLAAVHTLRALRTAREALR